MAKYDSLRKLERNRLIIEYRSSHPEATLVNIGELFRVSPQRVWEICNNGDKMRTEQPVT